MIFVNPMRTFAIQGIASLDVPETNAQKKKFRTALLTVLEAAEIDTSKFGKTAKVSNEEFAEHTVLVWYDVEADALRVFAPTPKAIDDTSRSALDLLHGAVHADLTRLPIEDLDAVIRVLALMSAGADDAADLHARLVAPNARRWDDDFVAPTLDELEAMWGRWFAYYLGGSSVALGPVEAWVERAYAFGTGPLPPAPRARVATKPKTAAKKTAAKKKKAPTATKTAAKKKTATKRR